MASYGTENKLEKATVALLDKWLLDVSNRVIKLEEELKSKDKIILGLSNKIENLENSSKTQCNANSADFWAKLPRTAGIEIKSLLAKEKTETLKKEKNLIVFGLPNPKQTGLADKQANDKTLISTLLEELNIDIEIGNLKITRLIKKPDLTNVNPTHIESTVSSPLILEFKSIEEKFKVLSS